MTVGVSHVPVSKLEMRAATSSDAAIISRHRYEDEPELRPTYTTWLEDAIPRAVYLGWLLELEEPEVEKTVIAGAGLVILEWGPSRENPNPFAARIVNVFVEPDFRKQGFARKLVMRCLKETRTRNITHLNLSSTDMARGLYESLGFVAAKNQMVRY
jgi:GNAT superfamily N-acetyltransferase